MCSVGARLKRKQQNAFTIRQHIAALGNAKHNKRTRSQTKSQTHKRMQTHANNTPTHTHHAQTRTHTHKSRARARAHKSRARARVCV